MKLLLDENISWKLVKMLSPIYGDCCHVDLIGLGAPADDFYIWNYALDNKYIIVTKDKDFRTLLEMKGFPPKIVLLKIGNKNSKELLDLLIKIKPLIEDLENNDYGLLEIINKR
jgi:predicted nuclease of predicted toxin-antitoxin system